LRKRYYKFFVARESYGQRLNIPIPSLFICVFSRRGDCNCFTITGMGRSYTRCWPNARFNQLRDRKESSENYIPGKSGRKRKRSKCITGVAGEPRCRTRRIEIRAVLIRIARMASQSDRYTTSVEPVCTRCDVQRFRSSHDGVGDCTHNATLTIG